MSDFCKITKLYTNGLLQQARHQVYQINFIQLIIETHALNVQLLKSTIIARVKNGLFPFYQTSETALMP